MKKPLIVQKFGGTSLGSIERIRHVAEIVQKEKEKGYQVIVVASAMAGATNQLVQLALQANSSSFGTAAYDYILSTGECVSSGLLALCLEKNNVKAMPVSGWQIPISTDNTFGDARIQEVSSSFLEKVLYDDVVPIVTGFQGVFEHSITTLGRGGSDTTAAALASVLKAESCDIYTDIDGIYTADPRIATHAQFIPQLSYVHAHTMALLGSKVLHPRSVEHCMHTKTPLRVLSSFENTRHTKISDEAVTEKDVIGISHLLLKEKIVKVSIVGKTSLNSVQKAIPNIMFHKTEETTEFVSIYIDESDLDCSLNQLHNYFFKSIFV